MTEESGEKLKEESGNKSWIILLVSVIVIAAIFAVFFLTRADEGKVTYNNFEFVNIDGLWQTKWEREGQLYILDFRFNPEQVEDVPVEGATDVRFQLETVYLTIDPSEEKLQETAYKSVAAIELSRKLTDPFYRTVVTACTRNETEACSERPIVTCENTNSSVIYLKKADETKIILDGNCVTIQGTGQEIIRAADKALFQWLGIMD